MKLILRDNNVALGWRVWARERGVSIPTVDVWELGRILVRIRCKRGAFVDPPQPTFLARYLLHPI